MMKQEEKKDSLDQALLRIKQYCPAPSREPQTEEHHRITDYSSLPTSSEPQTSPLLSLPRELRDVILLPLLSHSPNPTFPPVQPPITQVSHQLRAETLSAFYAQSFFLQLDSQHRLARAKLWLSAIGPINISQLRKLELFGRRRLPFGHMFQYVQVVVVVDLQACEVWEKEGALDESERVALKKRVEEMRGREWGVEQLGGVLEEFWSGVVGEF